MPDFILTTCGTSILTNGADDATRRVATAQANASEAEVPDADRELLERVAEDRRRRLDGGDLETAARASAELAGLVRFYGDRFTPEAKRRDVHYFLASDTFVGRMTRDLAMGWLRNQRFEQVVPLDVPGIRTSSLGEFRLGTADLTERLEDLVRAQRGARHRVSFNLAGGFKSVNAYLQMLGALWADEVFFVFEGSPELIRIPRLPVTLDIEGQVRDHLDQYRRLASLRVLARTAVPDIPDGFCYFLGDEVELSPWVFAAFSAARGRLYGERVWPPWSESVALGPAFLATTTGRAADRLRLLNERIDDLCRYAVTNQPLTRLDLKPLRGNPVQGSTHEADAWSDGSAERLFLHREGATWIIDRLAKALH